MKNWATRRTWLASTMLIVAAAPWLWAASWQPMLIGMLTSVTAISMVLQYRFARNLLMSVCGISLVIFFIAGLHREGIDIAGRPYIGMQLLTPFSFLALFITRRRT